MAGTADILPRERWHRLLTTRYICQVCLTRYFRLRSKCPACRQIGSICRLDNKLLTLAHTDTELRQLLAKG